MKQSGRGVAFGPRGPVQPALLSCPPDPPRPRPCPLRTAAPNQAAPTRPPTTTAARRGRHGEFIETNKIDDWAVNPWAVQAVPRVPCGLGGSVLHMARRFHLCAAGRRRRRRRRVGCRSALAVHSRRRLGCTAREETQPSGAINSGRPPSTGMHRAWPRPHRFWCPSCPVGLSAPLLPPPKTLWPRGTHERIHTVRVYLRTLRRTASIGYASSRSIDPLSHGIPPFGTCTVGRQSLRWGRAQTSLPSTECTDGVRLSKVRSVCMLLWEPPPPPPYVGQL